MTTPYSEFLKELQEAVGSAPEPYSILLARAAIVIARLQKWQDTAVKATAMTQDYALKNKEQGELLSLVNSRWVEAQGKVDELRAKLSEMDAEISRLNTVVKSWQRANSPGGWIDELRGEIAALGSEKESLMEELQISEAGNEVKASKLDALKQQRPSIWVEPERSGSSSSCDSFLAHRVPVDGWRPMYAAAGAAQNQSCKHCDDTGDVHGQDGEWRGICTCAAGAAPKDQTP